MYTLNTAEPIHTLWGRQNPDRGPLYSSLQSIYGLVGALHFPAVQGIVCAIGMLSEIGV